MKNIETVFSQATATDKKNKLNRFNKKVSSQHLEKIENGVTLEDLDSMVKDGLPIFKYQTQITIHGNFDTLENNRVFGYANLFQNKNKSIGVRYNAIDEEKRGRIAEGLKWLGIQYSRTSTSCNFSKTKSVNNAQELQDAKTEFKALADKFDNALFFGSKHVWIGDVWGQKYLVLDIHINAIYEKNIEKLLTNVGLTPEFIAKKTKELQDERQKQDAIYEAEDQARKEARQALLEKMQPEIDQLTVKFPKVKNSKETGTYLDINLFSSIPVEIRSIYLPKGKRVPRCNRQSFSTIAEALQYVPRESICDSTFSGSCSGYKIA